MKHVPDPSATLSKPGLSKGAMSSSPKVDRKWVTNLIAYISNHDC